MDAVGQRTTEHKLCQFPLVGIILHNTQSREQSVSTLHLHLPTLKWNEKRKPE